MNQSKILHEQKVATVVEQVKRARRLGVPYKKAKQAVSHFVPDTHSNEPVPPTIDLTAFNDVLAIDLQTKTCVAEPGLTYAALVNATLPHGLIPGVVPEHKGITIGGAVSGCSLESMSYKLGGFHDTCLEYEIVTGSGEVMTVSREENRDLFEMVHGSYGTMAVLTRLTFKLFPAKPFVRMENRLFSSFDKYWEYTRERCERDDYDFVDGILHAPDKLVACLGKMVDDGPKPSKYDRTWIYYKSTLKKRVDLLHTFDYFFRYDTDAHWLTRTAPLLENPAMRALAGPVFLGSTNIIKWAGRLKPIFRFKKRPDVIVDVFIPADRFSEFFHWYVDKFQFWPLWIVPYRAPQLYPWLSDEQHQKMGTGFLIDCAVYGRPNNHSDFDYAELLEQKTHELGGIKTLISRNFYTPESFWSVYSKPRYDAAKQKLDPENLFGNLYDKMGRR